METSLIDEFNYLTSSNFSSNDFEKIGSLAFKSILANSIIFANYSLGIDDLELINFEKHCLDKSLNDFALKVIDNANILPSFKFQDHSSFKFFIISPLSHLSGEISIDLYFLDYRSTSSLNSLQRMALISRESINRSRALDLQTNFLRFYLRHLSLPQEKISIIGELGPSNFKPIGLHVFELIGSCCRFIDLPPKFNIITEDGYLSAIDSLYLLNHANLMVSPDFSFYNFYAFVNGRSVRLSIPTGIHYISLINGEFIFPVVSCHNLDEFIDFICSPDENPDSNSLDLVYVDYFDTYEKKEHIYLENKDLNFEDKSTTLIHSGELDSLKRIGLNAFEDEVNKKRFIEIDLSPDLFDIPETFTIMTLNLACLTVEPDFNSFDYYTPLGILPTKNINFFYDLNSLKLSPFLVFSKIKCETFNDFSRILNSSFPFMSRDEAMELFIHNNGFLIFDINTFHKFLI